MQPATDPFANHLSSQTSVEVIQTHVSSLSLLSLLKPQFIHQSNKAEGRWLHAAIFFVNVGSSASASTKMSV
jgi:hypothetical protein